jgi:hypothetical protein
MYAYPFDDWEFEMEIDREHELDVW